MKTITDITAIQENMKTETLFSKNSDEWQTPEDLFQDLDREFRFDLDACATEINHMCDKYYSVSEDGLAQNWGGSTVWCNPPYSQIKAWVRKCYYEGHKPNTIVVLLIPARTDTKYFQNYILHRCELRFISGRLRFKGPGAIANAPFPSCLAIFRGPVEKEVSKQITIEEMMRSGID